IRCVAASLRFNSVDVLRVDLWAKIARDIRIRNGYSVDQPAHLVSSPNVKLVVREIRPRNIVRNEGQAVRSECARCLLNLFAINERGRRYRLRSLWGSLSRNGDRLTLRGQLQFKVQNWGGARQNRH